MKDDSLRQLRAKVQEVFGASWVNYEHNPSMRTIENRILDLIKSEKIKTLKEVREKIKQELEPDRGLAEQALAIIDNTISDLTTKERGHE